MASCRALRTAAPASRQRRPCTRSSGSVSKPARAAIFEVTASGPAGEIEGTFTIPFDERDLRILILEMGVPRGVVRGIDTPTGIAARELGTKLFEALFADDVGNLFMRSRTLAEAHGDRLRVTLALTEAPKLMHLPWEYLYDSDAGRFLAVSVRTPVVRYLEIPSQRRPMVVAPPLRILAMVSNPSDVEQLDSSLERAHLEEAIAEPAAGGPRRGHVAREREPRRSAGGAAAPRAPHLPLHRSRRLRSGARTRACCCSRGRTDAPAT